MGIYTPAIQEATGSDEREALVIEEVMRVSTPTLDHLTAAALAREARLGRETLAEMRRLDPECAAWYEECALGGRS